MFRPKKKSRNVDFLLQSKHFRQLHLILYFFTLFVIVTIYFILVFLLHDKSIRAFVFMFCSFVLGIFLVFKRDEIVLEISGKYADYKRKRMKEENKEGLRTTIRRIVPRNKNLKLSIKGKVPLKDRLGKFKSRLGKSDGKNKKTPEYIEIRD